MQERIARTGVIASRGISQANPREANEAPRLVVEVETAAANLRMVLLSNVTNTHSSLSRSQMLEDK